VNIYFDLFFFRFCLEPRFSQDLQEFTGFLNLGNFENLVKIVVQTKAIKIAWKQPVCLQVSTPMYLTSRSTPRTRRFANLLLIHNP
jgi:hypothetical protein